MANEAHLEVLDMIIKDMEEDAKGFELLPRPRILSGKFFTGHTVGTYFGNQGAAIATLAGIIKSMIEDKPSNEEDKEMLLPNH